MVLRWGADAPLVRTGLRRRCPGKAYGRWNDFSHASTVLGKASGFAYVIARKLGISMGIDIAHSRHQNAFYITDGQRVARLATTRRPSALTRHGREVQRDVVHPVDAYW